MNWIERAQRVAHFQRGSTAIEYTLMLGLIVAAALGAISLLGQDVAAVFDLAQSSLPDGC